MFEELRGLPPKEPKPEMSKRKKGCLKFGYGSLIVIGAFIIGIILILNNFNLGGITQMYNKLSQELSKEVDENELAPNKINENDYLILENKINSSITNTQGNPFFNEDHSINLENFDKQFLLFNSDLVLNGKDLACLTNKMIEKDWLNEFGEEFITGAFEIIELTLYTEKNLTNVKIIVKSNPSTFIQDYESLCKKYNLPMLWYLTYSFSFDNTTHEILSSSSQINKLSNEINTFVLQLITNSYGEKDSEQKIDEFNIKFANFIIENLEKLESDWNVNCYFYGDTITIPKE